MFGLYLIYVPTFLQSIPIEAQTLYHMTQTSNNISIYTSDVRRAWILRQNKKTCIIFMNIMYFDSYVWTQKYILLEG